MRFSNGTVAATTAGAGWTAVALTDAHAAVPGTTDYIRRVVIENGGAAGFFRINGGAPCHLPAGPSSFTIEEPQKPICSLVVEIQRIGATDLSAIFVCAW